ncbi:hypothetical protein HQ590_01190, partial [bacterium]|nr:hypothetical protein [bacterium]
PAGAKELDCKTGIPSTVDVVLEYSAGPWTERRAPIPVDYSGHLALDNDAYLSGGIGQDSDGQAFITIIRDGAKTAAIQFDFLAITKDGHRLDRTGWGLGGPPQLLSEQYRFDVPLAQVQSFQLRTRPVRTVTFRKVSLWPGHTRMARLTISIERGGRVTPDGFLFMLDGELLGSTGATTNTPYNLRADLQARLERRLGSQPSLSLMIVADRTVPDDRVTGALDAARQAGVRTVHLIVAPAAERE